MPEGGLQPVATALPGHHIVTSGPLSTSAYDCTHHRPLASRTHTSRNASTPTCTMRPWAVLHWPYHGRSLATPQHSRPHLCLLLVCDLGRYQLLRSCSIVIYTLWRCARRALYFTTCRPAGGYVLHHGIRSYSGSCMLDQRRLVCPHGTALHTTLRVTYTASFLGLTETA